MIKIDVFIYRCKNYNKKLNSKYELRITEKVEDEEYIFSDILLFYNFTSKFLKIQEV